ncbi:MAG: AraC family transcriptional regulator [Lachnospiraceae bacterium]|nr:AraC family transcriptional regulator [Lachnospiraceae bacterium]
MNNPHVVQDENNTLALPKMKWIRVYHNVQNEDYATHWHTSVEIIMPYVNHYDVLCDGVRHRINPGDVFIIAPGELHTLYAPSEGERLITLFDYSLFSSLQGMNSILESIHHFRHIKAKDDPKTALILTSCLKDIEYEFFQETAYEDPILFSLLIKFFVTIGRANLELKSFFPDLPIEKQHEYTNKFLALNNYISWNFSTDLTSKKLADMIGFTPSEFNKRFEQFNGQSFSDYLNQKRISQAEKLLIYPNVSTTEVATSCGYKSLSTFNRAFRSIKKISPTEYKGLIRSYDLDLSDDHEDDN